MTEVHGRHEVAPATELAAEIRQGLEEADAGETVDLGSFTRYLDDDRDALGSGTRPAAQRQSAGDRAEATAS